MMRVAVVYESTRGRTKAMAEAICEGVKTAGGECEIMEAADFKDVQTFCALAVGSSTRMKRVLPTVNGLLTQLPPLENLPAAGFGSYGWSGEAPDEITRKLVELGARMVIDTPIKAKDYPSEEILQTCRMLGTELAKSCST